MKYITITSSSFEEALKKAHSEYGDEVRVLSRRDYTVGGGLFSKKKTRCDLTIYLSSQAERDMGRTDEASMKEFEKEAQTPDPGTLSTSERLNTEVFRGAFDSKRSEQAEKLLIENDIFDPLKTEILRTVGPGDINMEIATRIIKLCPFARDVQIHPKKNLVLLGPTGSGKTTTSAKLAVLYGSQSISTALVSLDSFKVGAFSQLKGFCDAFAIPFFPVEDESGMLMALEEVKSSSLVIIDTMGISPRELSLNLKLKGMLGLLDKSETEYLLVLPASLRKQEMENILARYRDYGVAAVIATKLDESSGIGDIISFCYENELALAFLTNGQHVPGDIEKASSTMILENLRLPGLDMKEAEGQIKGQLS